MPQHSSVEFLASESSLKAEREKAGNLAIRLQHAEDQAKTAATRLDEVERREREAHEKSREQVSPPSSILAASAVLSSAIFVYFVIRIVSWIS